MWKIEATMRMTAAQRWMMRTVSMPPMRLIMPTAKGISANFCGSPVSASTLKLTNWTMCSMRCGSANRL